MEFRLEVLQSAHELTLEVYKITNSFLPNEVYGITQQLKRSTSSIAANINEGQSRQYTKEYIQFLYIARGSNDETNYFLLLAKDLGYINDEKYAELDTKCLSIKMMLNKLISVLKKKIN